MNILNFLVKPEVIGLLGVIVGGLIAVLGNLITVLIQRNQEKTKFQKEIYESRFIAVEEYLEKYMFKFSDKFFRKYENLNVSDYYNIILDHPLDKKLLRYLKNTNDEFIWLSVAAFIQAYESLISMSMMDLYASLKKPLTHYEMRAYKDNVVNTYQDLISNIDKFRLNEYNPSRINLFIKLWEWIKGKTKKNEVIYRP